MSKNASYSTERVVSIVGPRPNFIKLAPISWILKHPIIHTGKHYDYEMSRIFFDELNIPEPNHYLSISGGSDGQQISMITRTKLIMNYLSYGEESCM